MLFLTSVLKYKRKGEGRQFCIEGAAGIEALGRKISDGARSHSKVRVPLLCPYVNILGCQKIHSVFFL